MTRSILVLAGLVANLSCTPRAPKYELKLPVRTGNVSANGLRVIVLPDPSTQLVQVDVRYEVGSSEDPPGKAGLAHLVEHLMFQQRPQGPDQAHLFDTLRQLTIYNNAGTIWDSTHYENLAPKESLEDLIAIEADRMFLGCQTIPEEQFLREREVVRNEIRQRLGRPEDQVDYLLLADIYPQGHPYGRMIGGDDVQIASATLADACKFMQDYYVPPRATLLVAGATTAEEVSAIVSRTFAKVPKREPAPRAEIPAIELKRKRVEHELDVEETSVHVAWRLPPRFSPDADAARFMIGQVTSKTAREGDEWEFATSTRARIVGGAHAPAFVVSVTVRDDDHIGDALDAIWRAAGSAHRGFEDAPEFEEIQARMLANFVYGFEDLGARTSLFADYVQFDKTGTLFAGELDRIKRIQGDRIRSYIKATLDPDQAVVVVIKAKKGAQHGGQRASVRFDPDAAGSHGGNRGSTGVGARLPTPTGPSILEAARRFQLQNGLSVVLLPTGSHLPVMTAKLVFSVGSAHEPPAKAGLARTAAEMLNPPMADRGVGGEAATANALGKIGAESWAEVGSDTTVFTVRGLNIYQDVLMKGLERWIKAGDYDQEALERNQKYFRFAMDRRSSERTMRFRRLLDEALFGAEHPYAVTGEPTLATIGKIGRDAAYDWKENHFTAKNATLIIAGAFDAASVEARVRDVFGAWSGGHKDHPISARHEARTQALVIGVDGEEHPQLQVYLAYPAAPGIDGQHAARLVLANMLGRRMKALREELGSTYGAGATLANRLAGSGYVVLGGGRSGVMIDVERAGESLAAMRAGVNKLRTDEDAFAADFAQARHDVLMRLLSRSSGSEEFAARLELLATHGLGPDHFDKLVRHVAALSPEQVRALMAQELAPEKEILLVLGPREKVRQALQQAGLTASRYIE